MKLNGLKSTLPEIPLGKVFLVYFPLIFGAVIYVLYRDTSITLNQLVGLVIGDGNYMYLRITAQNIIKINTFITYSLPDGLWFFSFGNVLLLRKNVSIWSFKFFTIAYCCVVLFELFQLVGVQGLGTFDIGDIFSYSLAYVFSLFLGVIRYKHERY